MDKATSLFFSGHRPDKLGGYQETSSLTKWVKAQIYEQVVHAYTTGVRTFITGGAIGLDTWAAEAVLRAKESGACPEAILIIAVPCTKQWRKWPDRIKQRFMDIARRANNIALVPTSLIMDYTTFLFHDTNDLQPYNNTCMQKRNEWMVDNASTGIVVWDGSSGGTGNCVRYAHKRAKLLRLNPTDRSLAWLGESYTA